MPPGHLAAALVPRSSAESLSEEERQEPEAGIVEERQIFSGVEAARSPSC